MALSEKAKELKKVSIERKFSENLHDYLSILIDDDNMIDQMLHFLKLNPDATEDEVYEMVDTICPPPEYIIVDDDKEKKELNKEDKMLIQGFKLMGIDENAIPYMVLSLKKCNKVSEMLDYLANNTDDTQEEVLKAMVDICGDVEQDIHDELDYMKFVDCLDRMFEFDIKLKNGKMYIFGKVRDGKTRASFEHEITKENIKQFVEGLDDIANGKANELVLVENEAEEMLLCANTVSYCNPDYFDKDYSVYIAYSIKDIDTMVYLTREDVERLKEYFCTFIKFSKNIVDDRELAKKLKPSLKRFNFNNEELQAIAISVKQNPHKLQDCIDFLNSTNTDLSSEEITNRIIEICYL